MMYQKRIRDLREDHDLSQKQIADILGVTQTTYSQYELGKVSISIGCLITLCKFYHVSADYILGLSNKD